MKSIAFYNIIVDQSSAIKWSQSSGMDAKATRDAEIYKLQYVGGEVELPHLYLANWWRTSCVSDCESNYGSAILNIRMECEWPVMVDKAYVESWLYLPHWSWKSKWFDMPPRLLIWQRMDEDWQAELEEWQHWSEAEQLVEWIVQNWLNTL